MADVLSIEELAEAAGVPVRTVRYYISQGLIPGPGARGKAAGYGEDHLLRLRLARLLAERRVPLAEIAERLAGLSADETRELLRDEERRTEAMGRVRESSPRDYLAALLEGARAAKAAPVRAITPPPPAA